MTINDLQVVEDKGTSRGNDQSTILLLTRSINLYKELLSLIEGVDDNIIEKHDPSLLAEKIRKTREKIVQNDTEIEVIIDFQTENSTIKTILNQRTTYQKTIQNLLQTKAIPKTVSAKSLLANEMHSLSTGRKAMGGYKSASTSSGKLINRAG